MALDPDLVRCDLLKIKRKIYNSYPENSPERKAFLVASKMNEIRHLNKVAPSEVVNLVFTEYKLKRNTEIFDIILNLGFALSFAFLFLGFHSAFPKIFIFKAWFIPSLLLILNAGKHVWSLFLNWYDIRDFKKEYGIIEEQIKKLSDEVKRIGDGK